MPADVPLAERAEALQALGLVLSKCSPEALPRKIDVQEALNGPLGPYRARCRRAAEGERRALAHGILDEGFPTNLPGVDYSRAREAINTLLGTSPDVAAEEIAAEVLAPLQRTSRARQVRKQLLEEAYRDVEHRWKVEVLCLPAERQAALRRDPLRTFEAMDQARVDYMKLLSREEGPRAYEADLVRIVQERLAQYLKEVLPG